jgi:ribosomal protein S18 acetylase RimI-like enzyme
MLIRHLRIFVSEYDMTHILDNPIWWALNGESRQLGQGTDELKYFFPEVSPFAALNAHTPKNFSSLFEVFKEDQIVVMFSPKNDLDPSPWTIVDKIPGLQMVFEGEIPQEVQAADIVELGEQHVARMLALTQIAPPGPFSQRTIEFGGYNGIFSGEDLVAMAGERLRAGTYTEISAVCTHPDYAGRGFARRLIMHKVKQITAAGRVPYLHVKSENTIAADLYQRMGFVIRSEMNFYILKR